MLKLKEDIKILTSIVVDLFSSAAFITQLLQFFTGRWNNSLWFEVFMLVLFFMFARYPSKVISLFDAFVDKIKRVGKININKKSSKMSETQKVEETVKETETVEQASIGGGDTKEKDLNV